MRHYLLLGIIPLLLIVPLQSYGQDSLEDVQKRLDQKLLEQSQSLSGNKPGYIYLKIDSNTNWSGAIHDGNSAARTIDGQGSGVFEIPCGKTKLSSAAFQKQTESGYLELIYTQNQQILNRAKTTAQFGMVSVVAECLPESSLGGGCLIATATFDSELAPQVQKLREIRDSKLLQTESGTGFMELFNSFYYSFSPIIADYERENPLFKEVVKAGITPMLSTLSLLDYADSEAEVLGIGISLIILNLGMYVGLPVFGILMIRRF